ncbi:hypothetical protein [Streptococcus sp. E17BB]|uniref:hypothetical protein n=1 Tax=Streptococcus sp. E17BB TaxID=3278714 RepID=UPI00359DE27F
MILDLDMSEFNSVSLIELAVSAQLPEQLPICLLVSQADIQLSVLYQKIVMLASTTFELSEH